MLEGKRLYFIFLYRDRPYTKLSRWRHQDQGFNSAQRKSEFVPLGLQVSFENIQTDFFSLGIHLS